nr:LysE family transporter [Cytobacillus firmus]
MQRRKAAVSLLSFFLYVFVTSFTPGPNNIMAMVFANRFGLRNTIRFCLGVSAGFFVIMILCSYFNLLLHQYIPRVELIMTIIGVIYMLFLAFKIMTSKSDDPNHKDGKHNGFLIGMLLQFINPKGILYGVTVISTFILPYHTSHASLIFFSILLAFVGFLSTFCWSVFGSVFQTFLAKYRNQFNVIMALLLVYSAGTVLVGYFIR